eukprot:4178936-Amphidinium_carterae.1
MYTYNYKVKSFRDVRFVSCKCICDFNALVLVVRRFEACKPKRFVSDCKGVVSCLLALNAGRRHPKGRHRDLESRALAALPAGVHIVWMKAHQTERDADEGPVDRSDLQGNHQADLAADKVQTCVFDLSSGPGSGFRHLNLSLRWLSLKGQFLAVRFPAEPFVCGPYLHVVEHETHAICLDCQRHVGVHTGRGRLNYHALKGRPCRPFLRKKRAKLVPGFATQLDGFELAADFNPTVSGGATSSGGSKNPQAGIG